jgi:hypothetical protein
VRTRVNGYPLANAGLPAWAVVALDGAVGCGAVNWAELDALDSRQLLQLAREIVARQLAPVDVPAVIELVAQE